MMFFSCFLLLNLIAAHETAEAIPVNENLGKNQRIPEEYQPSFVQDGMECPKYRLLKKYPGFEQREYDETTWISTPVELNNEGLKTSYNNLSQFFKGSNSAGLVLSFTAPVLLMVSLGAGESVTASMGMFLSPKVTPPPKPLKSDQNSLRLKKLIKVSVYVKSFTGDVSGANIQENLNNLAGELMDLGLDFDQSFFGCHIFDFNSKFTKRQNEIWFLVL
ncbi:heme-binding protein 2-like [Anomaloglossus baeobatrachus]